LKVCDFDFFVKFPIRPRAPTGPKKSKLASQESIQPSPTIYPTGRTGQSRVLELRLMHHYTNSTCTQLPDGELAQGRYVWSLDIPRLAFQSELVLNALLGISALHHSALTPDDPIFSHAAGFYFDKAVRYHRRALATVDKSSSEAVLATAIIICHHTWISGHSAPFGEPYEIPLQAYYMARGIQALFEQMWSWLSGSAYLWYVEKEPISESIHDFPLDPWMESYQNDLSRLSKTFEDDSVFAKDKTIYEKTVEELSSMCYAIGIMRYGFQQQNIQKRVATMPIRLPGRFLELVVVKDPRALCLMVRTIALLKVLDPVWWLHGMEPSQTVAERSVSGIGGMLPKEWLWAMEWPTNVILGLVRP
jgi:hypothetical protein